MFLVSVHRSFLIVIWEIILSKRKSPPDTDLPHTGNPVRHTLARVVRLTLLYANPEAVIPAKAGIQFRKADAVTYFDDLRLSVVQ